MSEAIWIWCEKCHAMRRPHGNVMPNLSTPGEWADVHCSSCRAVITTLSCGSQFGSGLSDGPVRLLQNRTMKPLGPQEYPKCKYHATEPTKVVANPDEETALGEDWVNTPAAFNTKCLDCSVKMIDSRAFAYMAPDLPDEKQGPLCFTCLHKRNAADAVALKAAIALAEIETASVKAAIAAELEAQATVSKPETTKRKNG